MKSKSDSKALGNHLPSSCAVHLPTLRAQRLDAKCDRKPRNVRLSKGRPQLQQGPQGRACLGEAITRLPKDRTLVDVQLGALRR